MELLQEILTQLTHYHYTRLILVAVEIAAITFGILLYKKLEDLKIFLWYLCIDFTLFIFSLFIDASKSLTIDDIHTLNETINASVSIIEIIIYMTFFGRKKGHKSQYKRVSIFIIAILFLLKLISFTNRSFFDISYFSGTHFLSTISFLLIFPLSILNMKILFEDEQDTPIHHNGEFWITIGMLYYSGISTPYYYFRGFFNIELDAKIILDSALFYLPFTLNILCILIAFLCKKPRRN